MENEWTDILEESDQKGWNEKSREDEENVIETKGKKNLERIKRIWTETKKTENSANKTNWTETRSRM